MKINSTSFRKTDYTKIGVVSNSNLPKPGVNYSNSIQSTPQLSFTGRESLRELLTPLSRIISKVRLAVSTKKSAKLASLSAVKKSKSPKLNSSASEVIGLIKSELEDVFGPSALKQPINCIKPFINRKTKNVALSMFERVCEQEENQVINNLFYMSGILSKLKQSPNAMGLMNKALHSKVNANTYQYTLADLSQIFGGNYNGFDYENQLIEKMIEAKRFTADGVDEALSHFTQNHTEAFDLLANKKIKVTGEYDYNHLAKAVDKNESEEIAEIAGESLKPDYTTYLLDKNCSGLSDLLLTLTKEKMEAFKILLNADYPIEGITEILQAYTPEKHPKFLKLVNVKDDHGFAFFTSTDIAKMLEAP